MRTALRPTLDALLRIVHVLPRRRVRGQTAQQAVLLAHCRQRGTQAGLDELQREIPVTRIVRGDLLPRCRRPRSKEARRPRVAELLLKAREWRGLLESGVVASQAELVEREGYTRSRVSQILSLLRLSPTIQDAILALPPTADRPAVNEFALQPILRIPDHQAQAARFAALLPTCHAPAA